MDISWMRFLCFCAYVHQQRFRASPSRTPSTAVSSVTTPISPIASTPTASSTVTWDTAWRAQHGSDVKLPDTGTTRPPCAEVGEGGGYWSGDKFLHFLK